MKTLPKKISLLIMLAVMFSIIRPAIAYEHSVSNILEISQAISDANDGDTIILSSNLELNDSSVENSVGQGSVGYDGAVISGPSYYGTLNISNTTFRNSKNAFTGVTGGGCVSIGIES